MRVKGPSFHRVQIISLVMIMCVGTTMMGIGITDVFAQERVVPLQKSNISVTTDKTEYTSGDVIIISGNITTNLVNTPVILQIFRDGNPSYINQITPAQDNTYWDIVKAEGAKWEKAGEYEVSIRYGKDGKAITRFNFTPGDGTSAPRDTPAESTKNIEVDAGNETFDVRYSIIGGKVIDMTLDWRDFTLIVDIEPTNTIGAITMDLPRKYIGAVNTNGNTELDDIFIIQIDGIQAEYKDESSGTTIRTITINFAEEDSEIRIIGTYAVPEFSHYVIIMISIVGIMIAIITLSKTRHAKIVTYGYGNNTKTVQTV